MQTQTGDQAMAKKATSKASGGTKKPKKSASRPKSRAVARVGAGGGGRSRGGEGFNASDAFIKLLQSPLVAELVAIAATAALASLAEQGFTGGSEASRGKRAGRAVKAAGKAAAAAVGRRLNTEMEEIKQAAKKAKGGATR
jgi:hypothetical protein